MRDITAGILLKKPRSQTFLRGKPDPGSRTSPTYSTTGSGPSSGHNKFEVKKKKILGGEETVPGRKLEAKRKKEDGRSNGRKGNVTGKIQYQKRPSANWAGDPEKLEKKHPDKMR